jgi:hypothetical protein
MSGSTKPIIVTPRWDRVITSHRAVLVVFMVVIFLSAVAGIALTLSAGQTTAAITIALIAGGFFSAAAFC